MPFECPHCNVAIPNAVSQTTLTERLSAKDQEIAAIAAERDTATLKATGAASQMERLEQVALTSSFAAIGVADDATIRHGFRLFHEAEMAGKPEGERTTLAEWVTGETAKAHPMLSAHYGTPTTPTPTTPTPTTSTTPTPTASTPAAPVQVPGTPLPNGDAGATSPPTTIPKVSPADIAAHLRSAEYRALSPEKQREEFARVKAEYGAGDLFNPAPKQGL